MSISQEELDEIKRIFNMYDEDHDGRITAEEWYRVCQQRGRPITLDEAKELVAKADKNGNGTVEFSELAEYLS